MKRIYTEKIETYLLFSAVFRTPQALEAFFRKSDLLRPDLRMLDAGCGTGAATFALLQGLRRRRFSHRCMHAFDLTPAMLERFRQNLIECDISDVSEVEVREGDVLQLGRLPMTRRNWITKLLIEAWWKANRYRPAEVGDALASAGFEQIGFRRFPYSYFWQNQWACVVEARNGPKPAISD